MDEENFELKYQMFHARAKNLLGDKYDHDRVDGVLGMNRDTVEKLDLLEASLLGRTPVERDQIIEQWFSQYDSASGFHGKDQLN